MDVCPSVWTVQSSKCIKKCIEMSACNSWTLSVRPSRHTRLLCHRCQSQIAYIVILLLCNAMCTTNLVVPSTHDPLNGELHVICNAVSLVTEKYCLLTRYLSPRPTLHNHNRVQVQPFFEELVRPVSSHMKLSKFLFRPHSFKLLFAPQRIDKCGKEIIFCPRNSMESSTVKIG